MAPDRRTVVTVSDDARKHLARNIPEDFSGYCAQIAKRYDSERLPKSQRDRQKADRRWAARGHLDLMKVCELEGVLSDSEKNEFSDQIFEVAVRYEALLTSVDRSIEPGKIYAQLKQVTSKLNSAIGYLEDEIRNQVTCEMMECAGLSELPRTLEAFEAAPSLAAKVTIAELLCNRAIGTACLTEVR